MIRTGVVVCLVAASLLLATTGESGQTGPSLAALDGPPAPIAPDVITRDAGGRATVRAVRIDAPLRLDGQLDEGFYSNVMPISDFIQMEPQEGARSAQKTEAWVLFDDDNIYIAARCYESRMDRVVANEMRRDSMTIFQGNDNVTFILDTYHDRRNGVVFTVNPIGGRAEGQSTNERQYNGDFNPIWDAATGRFEGGWTVETAIPFKSLRYAPGRAQVWGINIKRENRWANEAAFIVRMPNALGQRAMMAVSLAATLVGLEVPSGAKNLEIKPYAITDLTTDTLATPRVSNEVGGDVGLDVKYGVTQNLTADFTYNTDFAQVEADEQQVNLTRFSLFFPEKREFFLENKGTFEFGGTTGGGSDTPTLFYSRRIGLHGGRTVPIEAGGRLTGRVGRYTLGLLDIQADEDAAAAAPRTNFAVARIKRDILRRSSIGALVTRRSARERGIGSNDAMGVDAVFGFFDTLAINSYWARTRTDGLRGDDVSYRGQLDYAGDRYGVQLEHLTIGDNFNPESGFLRRDDMRKSFAQFRFSPRPATAQRIRRYSAVSSVTYIENTDRRLESRDIDAEFALEFQNGDRASVSYNDLYEFLPLPFRIAPGVTLPVGGYGFGVVRGAYLLSQQRQMAGTVAVEHGTFYNGHRTTVGLTSGRLEVTARLSLQPTLSLNWVDLVQGSFDTKLVGSRVTYTMTPMMFVSALVQYNSGGNVLASNVRFRWEYQPGSELFVVYNEQRDTLGLALPDLTNRAVIVKINRLFRF